MRCALCCVCEWTLLQLLTTFQFSHLWGSIGLKLAANIDRLLGFGTKLQSKYSQILESSLFLTISAAKNKSGVLCVWRMCGTPTHTHWVTSHCSIHTVSIPLSPDRFQQGFSYSLTVWLCVCVSSVSHCAQVCSCEVWRGEVFVFVNSVSLNRHARLPTLERHRSRNYVFRYFARLSRRRCVSVCSWASSV